MVRNRSKYVQGTPHTNLELPLHPLLMPLSVLLLDSLIALDSFDELALNKGSLATTPSGPESFNHKERDKNVLAAS